MKQLGLAAMWLAVSAAIIVAIIHTGRISVLWFFCIPFIAQIFPFINDDKKEGNK